MLKNLYMLSMLSMTIILYLNTRFGKKTCGKKFRKTLPGIGVLRNHLICIFGELIKFC